MLQFCGYVVVMVLQTFLKYAISPSDRRRNISDSISAQDGGGFYIKDRD